MAEETRPVADPKDDVVVADPATVGHFERKGHRLTLKGMKDVLKAGGSIHIETPSGFRMINKLEDLPPDAELVAGDTEAEKAVLSDIDAQIAQLAAQRAHLTAAQKDRATQEKEAAKSQPKADDTPKATVEPTAPKPEVAPAAQQSPKK